jgi:hypothetical protein
VRGIKLKPKHVSLNDVRELYDGSFIWDAEFRHRKFEECLVGGGASANPAECYSTLI